MDLYAVLGVKRNASVHTIKTAYRKRTFDRHPDRNPGDETAAIDLRNIQLAYEVLSDPERREKYDSTGEYEESGPDNSHRPLMNKLGAALHIVLEEIMKAGRHPKDQDIILKMRQKLERKLETDITNLKSSEIVLSTLEGTLGRFKEEDQRGFLELSLRNQIAQLKNQQKAIKADNDLDRKALDYLKGCSFRRDGDIFAGMWMGIPVTVRIN